MTVHLLSYRRLGIVIAFALGLTTALFNGCGKPPGPNTAPPPPAVSVIRPVTHSVQTYHEYNGNLDAVEMVQVKARVKGILSKIHFKEGDDIQQGAVLYTIDPREYEAAVAKTDADIEKAQADIEKADADTANAEAQIKFAEADLARLNAVGPSASASEVDKAVAATAANRAQRNVAQANKRSAQANKRAGEAAKSAAKLDLEFTTIKAEISGRISRTLVTQGNLVGQGETTLLTTIVRLDKVYVNFDAPERDFVERLRSIRMQANPAPVPVEIGVETETGYPHIGVLDFRENRVDTGTGTIRLRGIFDNPAGSDGKQRQLYPGLYSRVRVPTGPPRDLFVIPEDAILTGQEGTYLLVVREGNVVKKQTITLASGPPIYRMPPNDSTEPTEWKLENPKAGEGKPKNSPVRSVVAVESGLKADDVVIISGLQRARPGGAVTPEEWQFRTPRR